MLKRYANTKEAQQTKVADVTNELIVAKLGMKAVLAEIQAERFDEDEGLTLIGIASSFVERIKWEKGVAERWLTKRGHALTAEEEEEAGAGDGPPADPNPADADGSDDDKGAGDNPPPAVVEPADEEVVKAAKPAAKKATATRKRTPKKATADNPADA